MCLLNSYFCQKWARPVLKTNYELLSSSVFSCFHGQKFNFLVFLRLFGYHSKGCPSFSLRELNRWKMLKIFFFLKMLEKHNTNNIQKRNQSSINRAQCNLSLFLSDPIKGTSVIHLIQLRTGGGYIMPALHCQLASFY